MGAKKHANFVVFAPNHCATNLGAKTMKLACFLVIMIDFKHCCSSNQHEPHKTQTQANSYSLTDENFGGK